MTTHEKALDAARHMAPGSTLAECAEIADPTVAAYLSALLPEDAIKLVDALTRAQAKAGDNELPAIKNLFQRAASLIQSLTAEIARCHARLEIDHEFVMGENDLERREIPMAERANHIDGIECRDATIKEQDRQIDAMRARIAERDELIAAFVRANDEGPGLIDCIDNSGERYTSAGLGRAIRSARALLNKDRQP